jgi:hypothetical protein
MAKGKKEAGKGKTKQKRRSPKRDPDEVSPIEEFFPQYGEERIKATRGHVCC